MVKLIKADFDGAPIQFNDDGWFNATLAAKRFNKDISNWIRSPDTVEYINALKSVKSTELKAGKIPEHILTKAGRSGGTWLHPDLAVVFARWLDVKFAIWCDQQIKQIIYGQPEKQNWQKLRHEAASSYKVMSEILLESRKDQGKETKPFHYANEAKLVNWALTGEYKPLDRDQLSDAELDQLALLENRNSVLLARGVDRETRKEVLLSLVSLRLKQVD